MPSIIPLIPIDLDKRRHLRFGRQAVFACEIELTKAWGKECTFFSAMRDLARLLSEGDPTFLSLTNVSILLWQACRHEDHDLTLETVQDALPYLDLAALVPIVGTILEAWQVASPVPRDTPADVEATEDLDPLDGSRGADSGRLSAPALA